MHALLPADVYSKMVPRSVQFARNTAALLLACRLLCLTAFCNKSA